MKVSVTKNDKTTAKDEIVLSIITVLCLILGIVLCVFKPSFWIIEASNFVVFGVILIMWAVMFIPCIIYRFTTNYDLKNKKEK